MLRLVAKTETDAAPVVELFATQWGYAVRYGLQTYSHHPFDVALTHFNDCVAHALACAGHGTEGEEE